MGAPPLGFEPPVVKLPPVVMNDPPVPPAPPRPAVPPTAVLPPMPAIPPAPETAVAVPLQATATVARIAARPACVVRIAEGAARCSAGSRISMTPVGSARSWRAVWVRACRAVPNRFRFILPGGSVNTPKAPSINRRHFFTCTARRPPERLLALTLTNTCV